MKQLLEKLGQCFGNNVKIRSQYHIQVMSIKGPHDIWITKFNELKFKRAGNRDVKNDVSIDFIIKQIGSQAPTSIDDMNNALDFTKFIKQCEQQEKGVVYTDAGFKQGKAKIAAIFVDNDIIDAKSRIIFTDSIITAEIAAIELGLSLRNLVTVYNDNQGAVARFHNDDNFYSFRVKWLPRAETKVADKISNLRKS